MEANTNVAEIQHFLFLIKSLAYFFDREIKLDFDFLKMDGKSNIKKPYIHWELFHHISVQTEFLKTEKKVFFRWGNSFFVSILRGWILLKRRPSDTKSNFKFLTHKKLGKLRLETFPSMFKSGQGCENKMILEKLMWKF